MRSAADHHLPSVPARKLRLAGMKIEPRSKW